jgi:hypothetical protein
MMGGTVPPVPMNVSLTATPQGPQFIPKQLPPHTSLPSPIPVPDDKRVPIKTPVPQKAVVSDPLSLPKSLPSPSLPPNTVPWRTPASKVPQPVPASSINQSETTANKNTDMTTVNVTIRYSYQLIHWGKFMLLIVFRLSRSMKFSYFCAISCSENHRAD